jgi:hypothetical protein
MPGGQATRPATVWANIPGMELKRVFSHKKLYPAKEHTKVVNKKKTP